MRELSRRIWYLLRRHRVEDELREEIEAHRAMAEDALRRDGASREQASFAARRTLGNDLSARGAARDVWVWPWLQDLAQDVRFAGRLLLRDRGFAATVVGVLGLGLGVNHLFLTLIYAHTLRGLPIERADRVLFVSTFDQRQTDRRLSYPEFEDLRAGVRHFAGLGAYTNGPAVIGDKGRSPDRFDGTYLSANAFDVVGVRPVIGRSFAPDDDRPGAAPVLMLGHGAWQARYGGDPDVVGRAVLVNGKPSTIIGVVPSKSGFPSTAEVWLPLSEWPGIASQSRAAGTLSVIGRLRDEVTTADGRSEIEAIVEQASLAHPDTSRNVRARVVPINWPFFGQWVGPWLAFISAGFLVLLVSAANVANLMLARAVQRAREMAVRTSLGASRGRMLRQLVTEAAVLTLLGSLVGVALGRAAVRLYEQAIPPNLLPYWFDYSPDARIFAMLVGVATLTLLVCGVVPAFRASKADVNLVLKDSSRTGIGRRGTGRWTAGFLTAQLALSTILLAQLVLSFRSDTPDLPSDLKIAGADVLTAAVTLPREQYDTPTSRSGFYQRLVERVRAMPGVSTVAMASAAPRRGAAERLVDVAAGGRADGEPAPSAWMISIGPDYFAALGLGVVRGRPFRDGDGGIRDVPAIVNERFVDRFLKGTEPLGQLVVLKVPPNAPAADPLRVSIVGVAPDIRQRQTPTAEPMIYLAFETTSPANAALMVRARSSGSVTTADLRSAALTVDPSIPLHRMQTMTAAIDEMEWNSRTSLVLIWLVTGVSIALAGVGLFAVTAYSVSERTQEIGLRMALGAHTGQVGRLIVRRAFMQVGIGLLLGILGSVAWDRAFAVSDRAGVRLADPIALAFVGAALFAISLVACIAPARRATRMDPLVALRHE